LVEKESGIPILRNANRAKCRHVVRVADIGQPDQAHPAPDLECPRQECEADRQHERGPQQLAEPLAQQSEQLP
jgi:hypothetical protein